MAIYWDFSRYYKEYRCLGFIRREVEGYGVDVFTGEYGEFLVVVSTGWESIGIGFFLFVENSEGVGRVYLFT